MYEGHLCDAMVSAISCARSWGVPGAPIAKVARRLRACMSTSLSATNPVQFYERLGLETTLAGCSAAFQQAIAPYGFDTFACGEIDLDDLDLSTFYALDWPERWRRLYLSSGLVHRNPLIEQISRLRRAFTWTELEDDQPFPGSGGRRSRFFGSTAGVKVSLSPSRAAVRDLALSAWPVYQRG
jgi:hypothetical protein